MNSTITLTLTTEPEWNDLRALWNMMAPRRGGPLLGALPVPALVRYLRGKQEASLVALVANVPEGLDANGWRAATTAHVEHLKCGHVPIQWNDLARDFAGWLRRALSGEEQGDYAREAVAAYRRAIAPQGQRPKPYRRKSPGLPLDMGDG